MNTKPMRKPPDFIERRKQHRLPYEHKIIFTDGKKSFAAYASNISQGGLFVRSMEPFPIDTRGFLNFMLPAETESLCVPGKVVHVVFDRQRCEVDNGMGFQFTDMSESQKSILNDHMLADQRAYLELQRILKEERPDANEIRAWIKKLPHLTHLDLLGLRYKVNRICTIFETPAVESALSA
jgi:uncharacterized protein (TIGR02266 family)